MIDWYTLPDGQKSMTGVESTEGYTFVRVDAFSYHYAERGGRTLRVWVERSVDARGYAEAVFVKSLQRWLPPDAHLELRDEEREHVRRRIEAAMGFMGIRCHFDEEQEIQPD